MRLEIPNPSLVLLIGISGSGKSAFARKHFGETQIVSSDRLRAVVCDNEEDQSVTPDAFQILHLIVEKRLRHRRLAVVDATNVQEIARRPLITLANRNRLPAIAIVLHVPETICAQRNTARPNRRFGPEVLHKQVCDLQESLDHLWLEGFQSIHALSAASEIENVEVCLQMSVARPGETACEL
ncbi:MAG: hypothetical protein AUJ79_08970 [Propionibacterium sp. CG1_02_60_36]|nr:MAG: hypothetical protein AUJ79_08970 [Propionibacterium sp. CG1_02_60_36]